jgi:hypothetical protein
MNCLNCKGETKNPKFCSRHCSTTYNNRLFPKVKPTNACRECGSPITVSKIWCPDHVKDYLNTTKEEMYKGGNVNWGGNGAYIRGHARRAFTASGREKKCYICSYSLHVDIAHVKSIDSYPMTATLREINNVDNLVALCKNHHWEFDNGHLDIQF